MSKVVSLIVLAGVGLVLWYGATVTPEPVAAAPSHVSKCNSAVRDDREMCRSSILLKDNFDGFRSR
jgi:hypothetical protein